MARAKDKKSEPTIVVEDPDALLERLRSKSQTAEDIAAISHLLLLVGTLQKLLQGRTHKLLLVLRRLFGLKTERHTADSDKELSRKDKEDRQKSGRQGRNGRDDYPGAAKSKILHENLKQGDDCPECGEGKLQEADQEGVAYCWSGGPPIELDILLLQRLICPSCRKTFTASVPAAYRQHPVDDSGCEKKCGDCDADSSANATVTCMRYQFGVPNYRLGQIQDRSGVPLPPGTQERMMNQVSASVDLVLPVLAKHAADADQFYVDDTPMPIKYHRDAPKEEQGESSAKDKASTDGKPLPKTNTTLIYADGNNPVVLLTTGYDQAGDNMDALLSLRSNPKRPLYMTDGLSANGLDSEVIHGNCLDHARRKFYDLLKNHKPEVEHVLGELRKVYAIDREAKSQEKDPEERLILHQEKSKPILDGLFEWLGNLKIRKDVEPNGDLAKAITYSIKRWDKLTLFLTIPGAPLSNGLAERTIKSIIKHRKNSLHYMNFSGAARGDAIQSVIYTCEANRVSPIAYLTAIQQYRALVREAPEKWMPWNYTSQIPSASPESGN